MKCKEFGPRGGASKIYYVNPPLHHVMLIDLTVKIDLDISEYKWIKFQGHDFTCLVHFQWHNQNKVGYIGRNLIP